jgi:hypothetical protein
MENVAIAVATSAYFLASADQDDAIATVDLLEHAATARLALERRQGPEVIAAAVDAEAARKVEEQVLAAWIKWYGEAFDSVSALPVRAPSAELRARIAAARQQLR